MLEMSQTDEEETSELESYVFDQENLGTNHSTLASKLALLAATGHATSGEGNSDDQISVDAETQARLEALLEAAGIGKLSTSDGKAFADPEVLRRLSSSVSCALDEAAAALSKMKADSESAIEPAQGRTLVEACSEGDVNTVRKFLFEGRSANETTEDGESLLSLACSAGYYELAEILLSVPPYTDASTYLTNESSQRLRNKLSHCYLALLNQQLTKVLLAMHANVEDSRAKGKCTPLMEAASGGYLDIVKLLFSHGADVNAASTTGNTALTYACCGGYEDVVEYLVSEGAELENPNANGHTPLMEAASGGHIEVASILLKNGAGINTHSEEFKESALTLACYKGHLHMVRFLLQAGADREHKTEEMHTALMEASMDGHVEVAKLLLDHGAKVNMPVDSFESPLTLAACGGHVELADLLIQRGALLEEINDEGYTPLMEAAREGHEEMVALLLTKGAVVNTKTEETQETALTLACCGGFLGCAKLLLSAGADIEAGCSTPVMEAAQEGQLHLVKYLYELGANINATTASGDSALSYAAEHGHTDVADYLLAAGCELEHETEGGRTPLMKAARAGHLCTVQFLISRGADVNRTTKNNEHSVLSLACVCGHLSVVELLLCHGADPNHKLKDGSNMLLEAAKGGHTAIVQLLLDFPHNFMSLSPENTQVTSPSPEHSTPRVPTQSLPMVVPPQEPDRAPEHPLVSGSDPSELALSGAHDTKLPEDSTKTVSQLQAFYQQQLQYYQQRQNLSGSRNDAPFNTTALVTHLMQQGGVLSQESSQLTPEGKLAVDKDVASTVESFLKSMAGDNADKSRTAESIVEEAQGKLTELELRIKEAIEKNAQLKNVEMMQDDHLRKEKVEELYKTREEQIHKKQKILEELQKVERELQMKTQQQLKKHQVDPEEETPSQRGNPDGVEGETHSSPSASAANDMTMVEQSEASQQPSQTNNRKVSSAVAIRDNPVTTLPPSQQLHNGSSGSFPQPIKDMDESFCQCVYHPCSQLSHPQAEAPGFAQSGVVPFPNLEIDGHTESNHDTPLTLAAAGGHDDLVQFLICRGANIEHKDKKGFTPLILAATAGHIRVVQRLLEANVDIEAQSDRTKDTPLSLACSGGRKDVVELLLLRGANKEHRNVSDYTPLSLAASGGYVNIIKILLSSGAEINSRTGSKLGISPLMLAAMNGHAPAVTLLLDMGADINAQIETNRNTSLTLACFQGRHDVVQLLVDRKANVEHRAKTGLTPLMEAASGGYADVGKVLLEKGADPNAAPVPSSRDTALTIAADKGHYRFCELILDRGAQVDVRNKKGNTPLWLACNGGHHEVVKLLVNEEADINAADNRNVTPLMAAFRKGHVQVVRWLAKQVSQFPSDAECMRYIATISDRDLLKRTQQCMECIGKAKELQAEEADKFASELLEEIDMEKSLKEDLKEKAARKRQRRKMKRKQKTIKKEDAENDTVQNREETPRESSEPLDHVISSTQDLKITSSTSTAEVTSQSTPTTTAQTEPSTPTLQHNEKFTTNEEKAPSPTLEGAMNSTVLPSSPVRVKPGTSELSEEQPLSNRETVTSPPDDASPRQPATRKVRKPVETSAKPWSGNRYSAATYISDRETNSYDNHESSGDSTSSAAKSSPRCPPFSNNNNSQPITTRISMPAPSKRPLRREEGWKEVATKNGKRIMVSSNLISRVIGRAGCNINAIREVTGAHIDIDKQRKGALERTVTIKGAADAIRYAQQLIIALLKEDHTDNEVIDVIFKAQAAQNQLPAAKPVPHKTTMAVVAAPIPSKPAWVVPPSIVAHSSRQQNHQNVITPSVGTDSWVPPTTVSAILNNNASNVPGKWPLPSCSSSTTSADASSTIQTVRKDLFAASQQSPVTAASSSVSFSSKPPDKVVSKPVQPVAPMVSTKITSATASRIPKSSYGPVGSGIPSQLQVYPVMSQTQLPPERLCVSRPQGTVAAVVYDRVTSVSGSENTPDTIQNMPPGHSVAPQSRINPDQVISNPIRSTSSSGTAPGHNSLMQNQSFRTSVQSSSVGHNPPTPPHPSQPIQRVNAGVARTPLRTSNIVAGGTSGAAGEMNGSYPHIRSDANPVSSPTYSPFRSPFTPNTALWSNEATTVSPYDDQRAASATALIEPDSPKSSVINQTKAPGYRGNTKSPASDSAAIGNSAMQERATGTNSTETSTSPGPQQGSPNTVGEVNLSKPRPIGTERAAFHRRANPPPPMTTHVGPQPTDLWSYDKLTPEQIGMRLLEQQNYSNWSTVTPLGRNNCVITTATSLEPQVTASEAPSSPKTPTVENLPPPTHAPVLNYSSYPPGPPPAGLNEQSHIHSSSNRFSQLSNPGKVAPHAPIGSHLGGNSSVGVVGPQQQQSSLKPIGSHLGGAGHIRNNPTYPQIQQVQRNFPTNPMQQQQQQPPPAPRYHHVPYYMQQPEMSRYTQNMASDINWQQPQQQQQQHAMYNPSSRHPSIGQFQHKEILNSSGMYGPFPPPYSNNLPNANANQGPVIQGYSNPVLTDANQSFQVHPDTQASYMREDEHFYNGGNEYVMRGVVPGNYTNPSQTGNADWDHRLGRTGYQLPNAGPNVPSMIGQAPGIETESQQQQMWKDW